MSAQNMDASTLTPASDSNGALPLSVPSSGHQRSLSAASVRSLGPGPIQQSPSATLAKPLASGPGLVPVTRRDALARNSISVELDSDREVDGDGDGDADADVETDTNTDSEAEAVHTRTPIPDPGQVPYRAVDHLVKPTPTRPAPSLAGFGSAPTSTVSSPTKPTPPSIRPLSAQDHLKPLASTGPTPLVGPPLYSNMPNSPRGPPVAHSASFSASGLGPTPTPNTNPNPNPNPNLSSSSPSSSVPVKSIDPGGYFELNNPTIHVLDNSSSGFSVKAILDLLGVRGVDSTVIPHATHTITQTLEPIIHVAHHISNLADQTLQQP